VLERPSGTDDEPADEPVLDPEPNNPDQDAALIRDAVSGMGSLTAEQRRFLAGYAYILVRIARADGVMNEAEVAVIEAAVMEAGDLQRAQGVLVAALAGSVNSLFGATEDYAFTREFARMSTPQQLQRLLRACVAVGAADGDLTAAETTELHEIGRELGVNAEELDAIREQIQPRSRDAAGHAAESHASGDGD